MILEERLFDCLVPVDIAAGGPEPLTAPPSFTVLIILEHFPRVIDAKPDLVLYYECTDLPTEIMHLALEQRHDFPLFDKEDVFLDERPF